jgi:hypothetical protein
VARVAGRAHFDSHGWKSKFFSGTIAAPPALSVSEIPISAIDSTLLLIGFFRLAPSF